MADRHHVFISHRHEDDDLVGKLKDFLAKKGAEVRDSSVTNDIPNNAKAETYIKQLLADRIKWAGKVLVIISAETSTSEWVDWEIEYANQHGKRLIGIWAPGEDGSNLPEGLDDFADAIVSWDADAIIDAINGQDDWEKPDGTPSTPREIKRLSC